MQTIQGLKRIYDCQLAGYLLEEETGMGVNIQSYQGSKVKEVTMWLRQEESALVSLLSFLL